ncbi:transposase [Rhodococcus sp. 1168]|uniref:transposase n=1 Tax=Rhodococcus sp. 1168 TaxID=2018041 RepID=UPI0020CAA5D0|nr:transposase [Rhodococcus sp. 1168]
MGRRETNNRRETPHRSGRDQLLLTVVVTAASIQDRDAGHRLLAALRGTFSTIRLVRADGGYSGRLLGWAKSVLALQVGVIKRKPGSTGFHVRARVWVVERTFAWLNKYRRCVRDYEAKPENHEAMVLVVTIATMTRRLART